MPPVRAGSQVMEGRRSNRKRKQPSTSEGVKIVRRKKRNQAASASEGDEIVVTRKNRNHEASASSEGGEILRRKKEMVAAIKAIAAEGMYGVKFTAAEAGHEAGAGKIKRTKVVKTRVPQEFIGYMLVTPHPTVDPLSEEELATRSKEYREAYVKRKFKGDKIKAYYDALLDQYRTLGYVDDEAEVDVTDDNEEN
ncbi:unnamed protein product [Urochloa humidicola]